MFGIKKYKRLKYLRAIFGVGFLSQQLKSKGYCSIYLGKVTEDEVSTVKD